MNMEQNTINQKGIKQKLTIELLIILALSFVVYLLSGYYDILEKLVKFTNQHENWELDEFIVVSIFLVFASAIFSLRRWLDLRKLIVLVSQRNNELHKLLSEIKQLKGIVPICAECKNIRDDKGYWHQVESYIRDHSEAEFSHGICPECMKKLYPEYDDEE